MSIPKVSVIVPVYNVEKYLSECIESILNQTFKDFELLLIDDGSPDNSGKICDEYAVEDSRIRVFHKENGGVSSARNLGLDNAKGEWIAFVDADDWVEQDYLNIFNSNIGKDIDFFAFGWIQYQVDGSSTKLNVYPKKRMQSHVWLQHKFSPVTMWGYFINAELLTRYHIRFNTELYMGEDQEFMVKCFIHSEKDVLPLNINSYHYRWNQSSAVNTKQPQTLERIKSIYNYLTSKGYSPTEKFIRHWYSDQVITDIIEKIYFDKNINKNNKIINLIKRYLNIKAKMYLLLYNTFPNLLKKSYKFLHK